MKRFAQRLVNASAFEYVIIGLIVGNGALLGMETSPDLVRQYGEWMHLGNQLVLGIFILEALLKMTAVAPQVDRYFRDSWNVFDF
jgi:voltage-gated sodium channel